MRRNNQGDKYDLLESGGINKRDKSTQSMLERENDERVALLNERVSSLRSLAVDIGTEVRNQNKYLDEMERSMGGLSGDFKRTMSRIGKAMTSSGSSGICLLVVFIVIVFVVLWRVI
ncbi:hypothetical protein WA588_004756, partial [Blastocystis sp. NMH]